MKSPKMSRPNLIFSLLFLITTLIVSACAAPTADYGVAPAASGSAASEESAAPSEDYHREPPRRDETSDRGSTSQQRFDPVTAGVVDDNEQWSDYLDYLDRNDHLWVIKADVSERIVIQVVDERHEPIHDAVVEIRIGREQLLFSGRTDAGGRLLFHPRVVSQDQSWQDLTVTARKGFVAQVQEFSYRDGMTWTLQLEDPPAAPFTQLDLLFLVDATGSMDDEIDKLKNSMAEIADQIALLPEQPSVRYGLVSYRDRGDAYVVRAGSFSSDLNRFQRELAALRAQGGGDNPEALNQALHESLFEMNWTAEDAVRLIILVADAPPHLDYREPFDYASDMVEAVEMGIKIFPVGASGLNDQGEYIFRQLAQFTGGKFVFLTYEAGSDPSSGPGSETERDVDNYSVDTLDRLVVRLVREELAKLPQTSRQ